MTHIPTLRLDPAPAPAWTGLRLALCAIAVLLAGLLLLGQAERDEATPAAGFLEQALGPRDGDAPLVREPLQGVRTVLDTRSFGFERAGESVSLIPSGARGNWTRYEGGAVRTTPFGSETVLFRGERGLEQFLTVERRQGEHTWSWQLQAGSLEPRLRVDGAVEFRRGQGTAALLIAPVAILDAHGEDVTPAGLRWSLAERGSTWWLELELDDAALPLPYVIDPAIGPAATATASITGSPLELTRPGNAGDLLLAQITVRSTGAITAPAGWNLIGTATGTAIKQSTYWKFATGSEAPADLTWSWPSGHGAGSIVAYANAHPVSPIDASNQGNGSSATASAPTVTTTVPNDRIVAFYGVATGASAVTPTGGQGQTALFTPTGTTSGGPAGSRITIGATEATQATAAVVAAKTATVSNVAWVGNLVAVRQAPDDGDGTLTTAATGSSAGSAGNSITFTYTAGVHGMADGAIAVDVPPGWSAPATTGSAAGYTTSSTGTVGISGQRVTVTGVTLNAGATITITYGSTASGGPGATASAATGAVSWNALARGTAAGTLTALGASPSITQYAADGSGTMSVSPTQVVAGNATTVTFTYTAAAGGMSNGAVTIAIPSGWTAPNTTAGTAGYTTASTGTVGWNGGTRILTVSGVTRTAGTTLTITYGTGAGGAVTVPAGTGTVTWQAQQRSLAAGTLANLGTSPGSTYNAAPTATVSLAPASPTTNQTVTATATRNDADGDTVTLTYVWKVNGVTRKTTSASSSLTDTLDLAGVGDGDKGQTVSVEVMPNDTNQDGTTVNDSEVVANSAPTISSVTIDQGAPTTNQTLSVTVASADADGDARTYAYQWRKNGSDLAGETAATLDLSAAGNGSKGDGITVEVVANDGSASSAPALSPAVTVANSAPTISSVTIDQGAPTTNQTLSVTVASADADGDARTYAYQWRKNGSDLAGETAATLDLSAAGNGSKGDGITVEVVANDGSASSAPALSPAVTVANSAPTITSAAIDQLTPKTNDTLTVSVASADADGDSRTYTYQWQLDGSDIPGETAATLDLSAAGNGSKGDDISVEVVANDGSAGSAPATSAPVTIQNSAPTVTSATIDQGSPKTTDAISVTVVSADADGDARTYTYQWQKNGGDRFGETAATFDLAQIGNGDKGDQISVEVVAGDGTASSAPLASAAVTVANSAPVLTAVSIDQVAPATNGTLSATITANDPDGDAVTPVRQWRKNGADLTGATGPALDLAVAGNGDKGDAIALRVSVSDGTDTDGPLTSSAVTIANSAPTITSVSIDQVSPRTDDTLTLSVASSDLDGDSVAYAYQWRKDGVDLAGETAATLDLSAAGNGSKDDAVSVRVTGNDGTAGSAPSTSTPTTIANTAPSATVSLDPASPTTNAVLTATAGKADADGDTVTLTFVWKVDGVTRRTTSGSASLTDTLDLAGAGDGDEGQTVVVEVVPNDGAVDGAATSDSEIVANSAPTATVSLAPAAPKTNQMLTATATRADADSGDTLTLTYVWKVDGVTRRTTSGSASLTDTFDLSGAGDGDKGQVVSVEVTPNDGSVDGSAAADAETVVNSAPTLTGVAIDQAAPGTDDTLSVSVSSADADGDAHTYGYQWKIDGSDIPGATTATLDLSQAGNGDRDDGVTVEVVANDGSAASPPLASAVVTVQNSLPVATVALSPDPAGTNDVLTATATRSDADGDTVTLTYVWKVNGATVKTTAASSSLTDTLDLAQAGNGSAGDTVTVEVTPNDGSSAGTAATDGVGVGNSLPTATVSLAPATPVTNDVVTATATKADTDGDTVTLTYVWKVNGATVKTTAGSSSLTDTLDLTQAGNGDEGETVTVEVTPNDGSADGNPVSDAGIVANTAPAATVSLSPAAPTTDDLVTATATRTDVDADTVTLTYVWKVDGATVKTTAGSSSLTDTLDLAQAGNGDKGETVTVEVTPNDGDADGTAASDAELVANSVPVLSSVSIAQAAPQTNDTLSLSVTATDADGDPLTPSRQWRRNGGDLVGETGGTLDLSIAGNGGKGDQLDVQLSVSDGTASSATLTSSSVTVQNSAPTVVSAAIDQSTPRTNDTLTVTVVTADADGDATATTYQWAKNGVDRFGETAAGYDLSEIGNGDKGENVTVRVVTSDGTGPSPPVTSSAVTVANAAPTVSSVTIDQAAPRTDDTLSASIVSADADGDARSYAYQWRLGGVDIAGATAATFDLSQAGNGDKGDEISVRVTASDGTDPSAPATSAAVTILNSAPTIGSLAIDQAAPRTNDTLTFTLAASDADGDTLTPTRQWLENGADVTGATAAALDLSQPGNGDKGDSIAVRVSVSDGSATSGPSTSAGVVVLNTAPTVDSVSIDQAAPGTDQVLTVTVASSDADGDVRTLAYQWRKNGLDLAGEMGATLDLALVGNGDKADAISVEVVANDGSAGSAPRLSGEVAVANSAPTITSVTIDQAAPRTNDVLSATVVSADADGDARTHAYQWQRNGIDLVGQTGATLDLSSAGNGDKADEITLKVTAGDGSASSSPATSAPIAIQNSAPTITLAAIDQGSARTNDTIDSTVTTADADGDVVTLTRQWTKNAVDVAGATGVSIDLSVAGNGDKGDLLRVRGEATDGDDDAAPVTSAPLTVSNSAPSAGVTLAPASPATDDVLTATATRADVDADTVTLTYVWKVEGVTVKTTPGSSALTDTLDLALAGNGNGGDTVSVDVTPDDGAVSGSPQSDSVTVGFRPDHLAFTSATTDLPSGTQRMLSVEVRDPDGALVAGDNSTLVTFAKTGGSGTVTGLGTDAVAAGVASLDVSGALAGALTITATAAGLTADASTFTVVHGAATQIDLDASGSSASGAAKTLTATIRDAAGNTVTSDSSTAVGFAKTGGPGTVAGLGADTVANGVASLDVTNTLAGQIDVEASAAGLAAGAATWTIGAGSASTATSTIDAAPSTLVADGASTSTVTVRLKDAAGNDLVASDGIVTLSLAGAGALGGVTDEGDGTYTATLTSPTAVGSGSITGTLNAVALADSAAVTYEHGPADAIVLTDSGSLVAGDAHTLTATIVDAHGNPVTSDSATVVGFAKASGTGTVSGLGTTTASSGIATKVVTNALAGPISLDATAAGLGTGTTGYTIAAGPVSTATSTVAASPTSVQNNGADTSTITVTVRDGSGNPLAGKTVTLDDDGADSAIAPASTTTNGSGISTFAVTSTTVETAVYTATAGGIELADTASVSFVFNDTNDPTNTITLAGATGAFLAGTDLFYRPAAAGSFTLSSAVADAGSGPGSATYPAVAATGWAHGLETVATPAPGPYVSSPFSWTAAAAGDFSIMVTAADGWTPANTSDTTIDVIEDSSAPTDQTISLGSGPVFAALSVPFVLGDGTDAGAGIDTATRTVTRESALLVGGACGTFTSDVGLFTSPDTSVQSGRCYRYGFTLEDRVGNTSAVVTSAVAQVDTAAPTAPVQAVTETGDDGHATGSTLYYDPAGSGSFTVTAAVSDGESGLDKVSFAAPATGFASIDPADDSTPPYARSYSWSAGATGSGAQSVTALDRAGHSSAGSFTLTPDAADPAVSFDAPAGGAMLGAGSHALEATAGDTGAGVASVLFEVSSAGAGGPFSAIATADTTPPYTATWDTTSVADGPKVLRATVTDNVGHTATATRNVAVDKVPGAPITSITSQPADPSANTTPTFGFGSSETPSTFECRIDGGGWGACASPHVVAPALADGSHTLDVRASDAAGNQDATPESHTWVVDATAPTGALTAPAALAAVSGAAVTVTSDSADGGSGVQHALFEVLVEGVWQALGAPDAAAPYSVTWDTTGLADGDHDLRVTTRDNAGNSAVSAVRTVTVDNSPPLLSASVSHNPVNLTTPDPAQVSAVADDLGSGIANVLFEQCNETSAACTSDTWTTLVGPDTVAPYEVDWAIPSDGPRLLRVTATDNAGRSAVELILTTVDRTRPSGTVTAPAAGAELRGSVALAATASDPAPGSVNTVTFQVAPAGAGVWDDLGNDGSAPYGATLDTTELTDGLYDVRVFTTDTAGNAETTPATISVRVDNTAPTTSDDAPAGWRDGDVAVTLTAGDPGGSGVAQTEYRLDGAVAQPYTGLISVSGEGVHALEYRSQDDAGNWESWQTATVRIDETDPVTADDAPAAWQAGAITVTLSPADAGGSGLATTTYELDGGATQTGTTVNVPATHGTHTITYRSSDAAGNAETDRSASVRIDRQAPTTSDDAPAGLGNVPVTVALTAVDADSGVGTTTYEVNGGATQSGTSVSIPPVTGTYTITYRSTDAVGNAEAPRTANVQIDATAPTTSATISPRNPNNGPITVSLSAVDAGGAGVDETRFRIDGGSETAGSSALVTGADGPHTVHFYSVDTLGNVEAEQLVTVTIDTAGPTGTPANPGGYLRGTAAELSWTPDTPADVTSVTFEFSTAGAGAWAALPGGTVATPMLAVYTYSWNTTAVADGAYDLRVGVEDALGNETIQLLPSLPKTVDNGLPTATVSTPAGGSVVSGSVALGGSAGDALSGITSTAIQLKPSGAAGFTTVASSSTGAVSTTWDSSSAADGPVEIKVVATDGAGNQAESTVVSFTVDNDAPTVTLADPGVAVSASPTLAATAAVDTASVAFEYREAGSSPWLPIGTDATPGDGFSATWSTGPLAEGTYELRARATDGGGNTGTSGLRTVVLDRTDPTGSVTAPIGASTIGGTAVALTADAADASSGVRDVVFLVKQFGSSTFDPVGTDTTAPYALTWDASGATDGAAEIRVLVTDVAGNMRSSAVVPVILDSSGPSVTLTDPGSVLSGTVALAVTTGGGAVRVRFEASPAGAGTWTEVATDTTAPFAAALDTAARADGVYDLRATGFDALDNPSTPSVRAGVRFDNTAPSLLSAAPADGSVSAAASQIVLEVSEPVTVTGALLDGAAAPAPSISGTTITFATGPLPDGVHVLAGRLEDASGTQTPFRVAVTIESAPGADRLPVERSMSYTSTLVTAAGGLATVSLPPAGWPAAPSPDDFLVVRVDPSPPTPSAAGIVPGGHVIEVTAHWALAGTPVTAFAAPLDITIPNPGGAFVAPSTSDDGITWRSLARLDGSTLPAGQSDGYYVDGADVHVLTRHLSFFALMLDDEAPTPPIHIAGVVADDGLTIRWLPGTDSSGHLGNVILVVNGAEYRHFGPTEYEAKLGAIEPGDTRRFQLLQLDGAGNKSILTPVLRAVPTVAGLGVDAARAALAERGFRLGAVREEVVPMVAAGTVVAPAGLTMAVESSAIDVVVARGATAAQTKFVLQVASAPTVTLQKRTTFAARVKVTRPAQLVATLYSPAKKRVFTWRRNVKAGSSIVRLQLPARVTRPGTYRVVWVARSGAETIRRTVNVRLVAPSAKPRPRPQKVDVVFAGERAALDAIAARLAGTKARAVARTDDDGTFALASSRSRTIGVAVVDVDDYGVGLVRDLGIVFPRLRLIGIARDPDTRRRAVRAGAVLALPRSIPAAKAARAIARIAGR